MTEQPRDVWGSVVPVDVIGSDEREPGRSGRHAAWLNGGAVIGVLAVVISVVMGAGIFAAASLSGGGPQPEDVLPGTSFAFAKVDLDPPSGQKLAIRELASKFPKAPAKEAEGLRDEMLRAMLESSGLSYENDVKPWLGSRAGMAVFRPADGDPAIVAAIQTKDRNRTEAALRKAAADEPVAFGFRNGYVVITQDAQTLDYALNSVDKGPLSEDPEFRADVDALDGDQVVMVWVDNAAVRKVMEEPGDDTSTFGSRLSGRSLMGLHATRDYVELQGMTVGADTELAGGPTDTLRRLPSDTAGALLLHDVSKIAEDGATGAGAMVFGIQAFYLPFLFGVTAGDDQAIEYGEDDGDFEPYCGPGGPGQPWTPPPPPPSQPGQPSSTNPPMPPPPMPPDECKEFLPPAEEDRNPTPWGGDWDEAGEIFEERLVPLLNDQLTFALGRFPADEEAKFPAAAVARVNGPGNAVEPFQDFLEALGVKVPVRLDGDLVYASTDQAYQDSLARDGKLGESDLFRSAMGDLGDSVVAAAYVNLDAVEKAHPDYPAEARPVDAVGISMATEGDRVTTRLRIVVR